MADYEIVVIAGPNDMETEIISSFSAESDKKAEDNLESMKQLPAYGKCNLRLQRVVQKKVVRPVGVSYASQH